MKKFYFINVFLALFFSLAMAACVGGLGLFIYATKDLPGITQITDYNPSLVTTIYANDGQTLGYLYREKRFLVPLSDIPPHLSKCFLAAEDASFYEHEGLDLTAIFRAFIMNLRSGEIVQGGSTITQQIIKQLLLSSKKKYERKIKEAILAYQLENYLTKDEILTIYLNQVFFGAGAYGVEAGARTYFGKHVGDLTLAESAVLAGLPKAPSNFNPFRFPEEARIRQHYVLGRMLALGWITRPEYNAAINEKMDYKTMPEPSWGLGAYYLEEVRRWLIDYLSEENMRLQGIELDRYGEDAVYESGLHVYTAIDLDHQEAAEKAMKLGLLAATKRRRWRGADYALSPGEIHDFLQATHVAYEELEQGKWVQALVLEVTPKGAKVKVGKHDGYISIKDMKWTWKSNATQVVKPGEMVWAILKDTPLPQKADAKQKIVLSLELAQKPKVQGALVSLEPPTGKVVAMVGGFDFADSQFNRATQALRQPGSAFKPIVYSTALDYGFRPKSIVLDSPISFGNWSPKNYGNKYSGPLTLETALVKSKNVVTVRIAARVGIKRVIKRARSLGLVGEFPPYLPICLGAQAVSPINLAQAYTAFARDGSYVKPRLVLSIKKAWGDEIFRSKTEAIPAISHKNAYQMTGILKQVVQRGTGVRAKKLKRPVAGKTGTTNEEKDAWFMGFSPYLLTAVYVGFDQIRPMGRSEAGSRAALPIWLSYRMEVEGKYPIQDFTAPPEAKVKLAGTTHYNYDKDTYGTVNEVSLFPGATGPPSDADGSMSDGMSPTRSRPRRNKSASTNEELLKQLY